MTETTTPSSGSAFDRLPLLTVGALCRALGCTRSEALRLRAIHAERVAAQLQPELDQLRRVEADRQRRAAVVERVIAPADPSSPDDVMVVGVCASGYRVGDVRLSSRQLVHWLEPEQVPDAPVPAYRGEMFSRGLLFCRQRMPDLRAMLVAGFADDELHGERRPFECSDDKSRIDDLVTNVVRETTDKALLTEWLDAANELDAGTIRRRLRQLGHLPAEQVIAGLGYTTRSNHAGLKGV